MRMHATSSSLRNLTFDQDKKESSDDGDDTATTEESDERRRFASSSFLQRHVFLLGKL